MSSNKMFDIEYVETPDRLTVNVKALAKVSLYNLAEALFDECCLPRGSCYLDGKLELANHVQVLFTPFCSNSAYSFTQHCCWVNPITILSDLSRQFIVWRKKLRLTTELFYLYIKITFYNISMQWFFLLFRLFVLLLFFLLL